LHDLEKGKTAEGFERELLNVHCASSAVET